MRTHKFISPRCVLRHPLLGRAAWHWESCCFFVPLALIMCTTAYACSKDFLRLDFQNAQSLILMRGMRREQLGQATTNTLVSFTGVASLEVRRRDGNQPERR